MKTVEYLNHKLTMGLTLQQTLDALKAEFGIKHSIFDEYGLVVLNYCQIESPKGEQIVKECRSLVLALPYEDYQVPDHVPEELRSGYCDWFQVVSRSFDRFFNYGEMGVSPDVTTLTFHDKLDGSLIGVFYHNGEWLYRTRSMIMPKTVVDDLNGITWEGLIQACLDWDNFKSNPSLCEDMTYILEAVSPFNRIVTDYGNGFESYLLSVRDNINGNHLSSLVVDHLAKTLKVNRPTQYTFSTLEEALKAQNERINLEEGVVGYDRKGVPVVKMKSPAYVAAHHLRGEGVLNARRVVELININEAAEYLSVFPNDTEKFAPWINAKKELTKMVSYVYSTIQDKESQKEFALVAITHPFQGMLFAMRKGLTLNEAWFNLSTDKQVELLKKFI